MNSSEIRNLLVSALRLDTVGPDNDHEFARELLPERPQRWYLTGFLVPADAKLDVKSEEASQDDIEEAPDSAGLDDDKTPEKASAKRKILPSSMGLSVLVGPETSQLAVTVAWGDYQYEGGDDPDDVLHAGQKAAEAERSLGPRGYRRIPNEARLTLPIPAPGSRIPFVDIPNSGGLVLSVNARPISAALSASGSLPAGTRSVSVFLVNLRPSDSTYRTFVFQTTLTLESHEPFIPRPNLRGLVEGQPLEDWDDRIADVQYRDVFEYAVGHGVSAAWEESGSTPCTKVWTTWLPSAHVERVAPGTIEGVELGMEALGNLDNADSARAKLMPIVTTYKSWIATQLPEGLSPARLETAKELLALAGHAAKRIERGIEALSDPDVLEAFRIANRAMALAARRREWQNSDRSRSVEDLPEPRWRPFQLAFFLMSLRSISEPESAEREIVDLLFFPTGGGKTEAYLGLAAFAMVLRRLRGQGVKGCGVSVLMRYTLRLLTLDQLGRASALICALELEREKNLQRLGTWPFEIGLWVGQAATPNRLGGPGDSGPGKENTAYSRTLAYKREPKKKPMPVPIDACPWCGEKFTPDSFRLVPDEKHPADLRVHCTDYECVFSGDRSLPIVTVDEPIYRRLPAFLIATIDKFAALPWTGETATLFGRVDRFDENGFYGPCSPPNGQPLGGFLPPPDLIIQDELHLISGPLGTVAGVYEAAIDHLASRKTGEKTIRPKIVASTATVRRADSQIEALFDRHSVSVFPPPGPNRRDSFFAKTEPPETTPARLYLGISAQGRSLKVVLLRVALALMAAAKNQYEREGGKANPANPADPYMTLLGYFNSLRELGGSRRIVEDEVRGRLALYGTRKRLEPKDTLFVERFIRHEVLELTSRVPTGEVATAKRRLALPFHSDEHVDTALATNMISVGLDIIRLGLMVVLGQPKTSAEYIQATSRVGRDPKRPGLVVTVLNVHKPRDRSHYERFQAYHASFYRSVEVTSVTPYSPRALDRALPAVLVGLCRLAEPAMTPARGAVEIRNQRPNLTPLAEFLANRAKRHAQKTGEDADALAAKILNRCTNLLDAWLTIAEEAVTTGPGLQYQQEVKSVQRLIYDFLHPDLPSLSAKKRQFRANRSMRDVEAAVDIFAERLPE